MTVYVDPLMQRGWILRGRRVPSSHMFTDQVDLSELHELARRIGCRLEWFQEHDTAPHYDLTAVRRQSAVDAGAHQVDHRTAVSIWHRRQMEARRAGRLHHEWDEDAICMHCGFDGAEDHWLNDNLRREIGDGEFKYRQTQGEFDAGRYCQVRTEKVRR